MKLLSFSVGLAIVAGCSSRPDVPRAAIKVPGYDYSFDWPVTNVPPGTVIIKWKKGLDPLVRPDQYLTNAYAVSAPNPSIQIDEAKSRDWKFKIDSSINYGVKADLGFTHSRLLSSEFTVVPLELTYPGGPQALANIAARSDALREAVTGEIRNRSDFKFLSIVTRVAKVDFTYIYDVSNSVQIAGNSSVITNLRSLSVNLSTDLSNTNHLKIKSVDSYVAYSTKSGILRDFISEIRQENQAQLRVANFTVLDETSWQNKNQEWTSTNKVRRGNQTYAYSSPDKLRIAFYFSIDGFGRSPGDVVFIRPTVQLVANGPASNQTVLARSALVDTRLISDSWERSADDPAARKQVEKFTGLKAADRGPNAQIFYFVVLSDLRDAEIPKGEGYVKITINDEIQHKTIDYQSSLLQFKQVK
jgi:hypothetical protein